MLECDYWLETKDGIPVDGESLAIASEEASCQENASNCSSDELWNLGE